MRREEKLSEEEAAYLKRLCASDPAVADAQRLTQWFARIVCDRECEELDGWLEEAEASEALAMKRFAAGLKKDLSAPRYGTRRRGRAVLAGRGALSRISPPPVACHKGSALPLEGAKTLQVALDGPIQQLALGAYLCLHTINLLWRRPDYRLCLRLGARWSIHLDVFAPPDLVVESPTEELW